MSDNIIEISSLVKSYGELRAVDGVSFSVKRGELFAFLGVNGAGKSTTINVLCTLLKKDSGKVLIDGFDLDSDADKIKRVFGVVFQNSVLDARLSVKDNLTVRASYYGISGAEWKRRLDELTERLELGELLKRPFGKLSGGQKRRADIARGLIHSPKLLFLDEPTTGLDPQTRKNIWNVINDIRAEKNTTVFLTTHYMEEADEAGDVVIIDRGKVIAQGTPTELKNTYSGDYVKLYEPKTPETDGMLAADGCDYCYENGCYTIRFSAGMVNRFVKEHISSFGDFEVVKGDMDDAFLNATGHKAGEM